MLVQHSEDKLIYITGLSSILRFVSFSFIAELKSVFVLTNMMLDPETDQKLQ